jgi:hypothetical protein
MNTQDHECSFSHSLFLTFCKILEPAKTYNRMGGWMKKDKRKRILR